jgi:hypothetical protein
MRSKQHLKAVELYTCAIALSRNNAIYYCNRYAQINDIYDDLFGEYVGCTVQLLSLSA